MINDTVLEKDTKELIKKINKDNKLTHKEKVFAIELLTNGGNKTRAAMKAYNIGGQGGSKTEIQAAKTGYSIARETLGKPRVQKYLDNFGDKAGAKIIEHIDNEDANISLKASIFTYEQVHGKATQKTETSHKFMLTNRQNEPIEDLGNIVDTYAIETKNDTEETEIDTIDNY